MVVKMMHECACARRRQPLLCDRMSLVHAAKARASAARQKGARLLKAGKYLCNRGRTAAGCSVARMSSMFSLRVRRALKLVRLVLGTMLRLSGQF